MDQARDKIVTVAAGKAVGSSPQSKNAIVRAGKSLFAGVKRLNKRVGAAEARLILRVFYLTVIGVASLALRSGRRKAMEAEENSEIAWAPRVSPGTDPTKQY
jgi:hypothetical protein